MGKLAGSLGLIGDQQLHGQLGLPQPPGGVQSRGQGKSDILAVQSLLVVQLGQLQERLEAKRRCLDQAFQAVPDQDAVLVDQRHHVGHRAQGGQSDRLQ